MHYAVFDQEGLYSVKYSLWSMWSILVTPQTREVSTRESMPCSAGIHLALLLLLIVVVVGCFLVLCSIKQFKNLSLQQVSHACSLVSCHCITVTAERLYAV
jgi:hypothetical protein